MSDAYLAGVSTMSRYVLYKNRNDMTSRQYMQYVEDWRCFDRIWIENYRLSTIGAPQRYTFLINEERMSYLRGQAAHIDVYDSNSPGRILGTIPVESGIYSPPDQFITIS